MGKVIDFLKSNIRIIIILAILLVFFITFLFKNGLNRKTTYTVVNGDIESLVETNLYLIKKEHLIDYDNTQAITSIIEQGKRASKNEAIATYQNESYVDYQKQISDIDKQIQTLIKDLPVTYSADISSIEEKILKYSNEVQKTTSYLKMQEYKSKIDELAYRKITILANSSPDSSAIRDLVSKREELIRLSKRSDTTIWTDTAGIVTYKIDGLENKVNFGKVEEFSASDYDNLISMYDGVSNNEFGIKVVDNFKAYFLVKSKSGVNDEHIQQGKKYNVRVADLENSTLKATLIKNINENGYNYSLFEIQNEIDNLVDYRKLSCEVIWKSVSGMAVPLNAIYNDSLNGYDYVLMVFGTDYVRVPINIKAKSDSIALVENVDKETTEKLGLDTRFKLELYDELIIEEK